LDPRGQALDWENYEKMKVPLTQPVTLKQETWALVYSNRDYDNANALVDNFKKASGVFGIKV